MRCVIDQQNLSKAVRQVQGIVSPRATLPILSHFLIAADGPSLRLTATDLETTARVTVLGEPLAQGRVLLPAHKLTELVRELPALPVTMDGTDPQRVVISCGGARYRLAGLPPDDFPSPEPLADSERIEIPADTLQAMLAQTSYAASTDSTRYALNGVLFTVDGQTLSLVATDGHRLALAQHPIDGSPTPVTGIVPKKAVQQIDRLLEAGDVAALALSERALAFTMPGIMLTTRLIEGTFPNYRQVIPTQQPIAVTIPRRALVDTLRRVSVLTETRQRAVTLTLSPGVLRLSAVAPDIGEAEESLPVEYAGEPLAIGMNASYLLDAVTPLDADQVAVELKDPMSPVVVHPEKNTETLAVIMPLRL